MSLMNIYKGKGHPMTCRGKNRVDEKLYLQPIHNSKLEGDGCLAARYALRPPYPGLWTCTEHMSVREDRSDKIFRYSAVGLHCGNL
jgi:hypothetical protein